MATSRSGDKNQMHDIEYYAGAGSSHLIRSALAASSGEKVSDPRMTQSQIVNRPHKYTVTITPPEVSVEDRHSALFFCKDVSLSRECQEKTEFLKLHFPSLFVKDSLITEPVIIMKDDAEHKDYEEKLRQQPSEVAVAAFNKNGFLIIKHVAMKKCIEKLLALTLEQLKSNDIKEIFEDILEDTIGDLEPFKSDDDIVLTASGHSYLSAPLTHSLEIKRVDPNTNEVLQNSKIVKDAAVKTFLGELDILAALNDRKFQCNSSC